MVTRTLRADRVPDFVTTGKAAALLRIDINTVRALCKRYRIGVKVTTLRGRPMLVLSRDDVLELASVARDGPGRPLSTEI